MRRFIILDIFLHKNLPMLVGDIDKKLSEPFAK
jgi:hypothetical protein